MNGAGPDDRPSAQPGALPIARPELGRREHDRRHRRARRLREPGGRTRARLQDGGPRRPVGVRGGPSRRLGGARGAPRRRRPDARREVSGELRARHSDGSWRSIEAVGKNLLDDPAVGGIVVNYRDITARKTLEDELRHQAFHDSLTGLANRGPVRRPARARAVAARRAARRPARRAASSTSTTSRRSTTASATARATSSSWRSPSGCAARSARGDTLARMGGDEFAILVEDPSAPAPPERGRRAPARRRSRRRSQLGGQELFVRASIGIAVARGQRTTAEELLRNADIAMYMAKSRRQEPGRDLRAEHACGGHSLGSPSRATSSAPSSATSSSCTTSRSWTSPTGAIVGVEALLRWRHPTAALIPPIDFIPLAEETGLIIPLGRWVLDEACRQVAPLGSAAARRPRLSMNVNVSARQVASRASSTRSREVLGDDRARPGPARARVHRERR